jgi:pectin methylesterase-like acyl-CoA thioesterase
MMLASLLTSLLATAFYIRPARARTIIVPDDYSTIQQAVNAAANGDTVYVKARTYVEDVLIDNKSISLIGEGAGNTIIKGVNCVSGG